MLNRALRLLRTYHQLKQIELAKKIGISNSYLSEIEKGEKTPGLDILEKYSEVFRIPTSSILLFSESLKNEGRLTKEIRFSAAEKVLRLLEWIEERDSIANSP